MLLDADEAGGEQERRRAVERGVDFREGRKGTWVDFVL
jgi:hypothetical protein